MILTSEEMFALEKIFGSDSHFDSEVRAGLFNAEVIERKNTGVGFFSTIRFPRNLPDSKGRKQWDWNFQHAEMIFGGSFMASLASSNVIELEAVVHDGSWPSEFRPELFREG